MSDTPESPQDKFRRLASSESAADASPTPPGEASPPSEPAESPSPEASLSESETLPEAEEIPPSEQPTVAPDPSPENRHPTGEPDLTGGWYQPDDDRPRSASPFRRRVVIDEAGMPRVPRTPEAPWSASRVPERDPYATRVQASATRLPERRPPPAYPPPPETVYRAPERRAPRPQSWAGCLWRLIINGLLLLGVLLIAGVGALGYGYWAIARTLPPVSDLQNRASQFETTRVYDARNNLLYEIVDPQAGRRTRVALNQISPQLIAATIATEDKDFYSHPGFDPLAILRAIWQNTRSGETVSGASTITQQLVRALILTPEERAQRTNMRKIREIILAAEITRRYEKDEILTLYLNEIYYGNLAYGIEAAAETYFHKKAIELTLSEASFLAGLPQAPAVYDVYTDRDAALGRQRQVLGLMLALGCIGVSTQPDPVCVNLEDVQRALLELAAYPFTPPRNDARFPHWVNYVRQLLEEQYDAQSIYRAGYNVYTTLDPDLQALGQAGVAAQVAALAGRNVTSGALVALRPSTGEILAMIGSDDFNDPVDGQINMAVRPRQPGSSIKPLTYALAFEKGWTPATLIWDVPTEFPDGANPPYVPVNYDGRFHGPTLVRAALANSYNVPAVKTLEAVGIYADGGFIQFAKTLGITSLTSDQYGLSLTLGGGEVPLLQMVEAYGALATGGQRVFPFAIRRITDFTGNRVFCEQPLSPTALKNDPPPCQSPPENWGRQVISPENAFLITDILSDNAARSPAFGPNSLLRLSFPAAAKTGTTNDIRDNWTIGYTPDLVTGVWVGNPDFTPMVNTSGLTGAAPIWHDFMEAALAGRATPFARPQGILEKMICGLSGTEPSEFCPPNFIHPELFSATNGPLPKERDLWQQAFIDSFTGLRQTAECARYYQNDRLFEQGKTVIAVLDPWARKWLTEDPNGQAWAAEHGITAPITWAPAAECTADSPHPIMSFAYPPQGASIPAGPLQILGQAGATADFAHYILEYGLSENPEGWGAVLGPNTNPVPETNVLANWDTSALPDGPVTLRVIVFSRAGGFAEARVTFTVQQPTPTPTPTDTATATPTQTLTPSPTPTATPTPLASPTSTPSATSPPTALPTDTPPAPSNTPPSTP